MKVITKNSNLVNDITVVDTTNVNITLQLPKATFAERNFKIIKIGAGLLNIDGYPNVLINNEERLTINDSNVIIDLIYQNTTENVNIISVVSGSAGGGDYVGWTLGTGVTRLDNSIGLTIEGISTNVEGQDYVVIIDTTTGPVIQDLTLAEEAWNNIFKFIKVNGNDLLTLQSDQGFDIGGNELVVSDSCLLFNDATAPVWQVLFNNEWKTKVVDITADLISDMGSNPIQLLPAAGAGKYYDIESVILEFTAGESQYSVKTVGLYIDDTFTIGSLFISSPQNRIAIFKNVFLNIADSDILPLELNYGAPVSLRTSDGTDPTGGDGTMRAIIKYKIRTFGA